VLIACRNLPLRSTYEIVVVDDSSRDGTKHIAAALLQGRGTVLSVEAQTVGTARALAAARLLDCARRPMKRIWLANTDADCVVPPMWLRDQLRLARAGIEAIAGVVDVDSFAEHSQGVAEKFRATYLIRPDGTHPHIHGANIGFRTDTYLRAGGWADLTTAEDHDLWRRLVRDGARTVSTAKIQVITSGRRHGRAPHGFAGALAAHGESESAA
jgi:cellulose synthase/poly-beta-1,6-N-acetylglucosamine synthase-like glycosyltransferase